jgi:hypothetical protein
MLEMEAKVMAARDSFMLVKERRKQGVSLFK